jgi:hypothetical protein
MDYADPNPKIVSNDYQAVCIQNEFPLDSLIRFPAFYHGEKMGEILFSELVHKAAVRGGFHLMFLRKIENRDKMAPLKYTKFDRVQVVEIIDGLICCSCNYYQRFGLPFRHLPDVTQDLKPEYCELR